MQKKCPPSHFLWWQIIKVPTYKSDNFLQKSSRSSCMCWVPSVYLCVFHLSVSVPLSFAFFIHNFGRETVIFVYVGDKEVTKDYLTAVWWLWSLRWWMVMFIEMVVMEEVDREVAMVSDQVSKRLKRIWTITPLPAQISASNFHDLTQITKRTEKHESHCSHIGPHLVPIFFSKSPFSPF